MEKYETVNNTHIEMHKRAGWVNIYKSEKVQAEIDRILTSNDPKYKLLELNGNRMKALKFLVDEYSDDTGPESLKAIMDNDSP